MCYFSRENALKKKKEKDRRKMNQMKRCQTLTGLSFTPVSFLSVPLIVLPIQTRSLVAVSALVFVVFTVGVRITFVIVHIVLISVALAAAIHISP